MKYFFKEGKNGRNYQNFYNQIELKIPLKIDLTVWLKKIKILKKIKTKILKYKVIWDILYIFIIENI